MAIYKKGDVNMDGQITQEDANIVLNHANETALITDETILDLADVTEDGEVTLADYGKIVSLAKSESKVYGYKNNSTKVEVATTEYVDNKEVPNATSTTVGGMKIRLDGSTLYITTDGSDA